jgi:hypothetical protein
MRTGLTPMATKAIRISTGTVNRMKKDADKNLRPISLHIDWVLQKYLEHNESKNEPKWAE